LRVVAPTKTQAFNVTKQWTNAFLVARNQDAARQVTAQTNNLKRTINSVHGTLFSVDLRLAKLLPNQFNKLLQYDFAGSSTNSGATTAGAPPLCEICNTSVYLLNLWTERLQLVDKLVKSSNDLAAIQVQNATPGAFGQALAQTPGNRITTPVNYWTPALIALLVGLLLALAAAVLVDRLDSRIRDPEDAASAFSAPVLSVLPWSPERVDVVSEPNSDAAEAYRALAALAIATDRLPRAVMVTSPTGDTYEEVAANFAAALSSLGL